MTDTSKLDFILSRTYRAALDEDGPLSKAKLAVLFQYSGTPEQLEDLGVQVVSTRKGYATGIIDLTMIPDLIAQDWIDYISVGEEPELNLQYGTPDVRARASSSSLTDGTWHIDTTSGALSNGARGTGAGVIVAIIDTGIDYTHPMFMSQLMPVQKTRILRIWDMGIAPATLAEAPSSNLLKTNLLTYGREYKKTEIDANLASMVAAPLPTRDCHGHGTHVAGIAAGRSVYSSVDARRHIGVAPEADIVVVKALHLDDHPKYFGTNT